MAKDLKVEDYEALVLPATGLVAMRFLKDTITELKGDVVGFEPYTAKRMHDEGLAEPVGAVATEKPAASTAKKAGADEERRGAVEIPEKWQDEHHLTRVALAKKITGTSDDLKAAEADKIIQDELDRRVAA